jgi:hypothetical protein
MCIRDSSGQKKRHLSLADASLHQDEDYGKSTESNDVKKPNPAVQRTQAGHYGWLQWLRWLCSPDKLSPSLTGTDRSSSPTGTDDDSWYVDADARAQMRREHARMFAETYRQIHAERCGSKTSSGSELSFGRVSVQNISIEEGLKTTSPDTSQFHGVLFTKITEKTPVIRTASGGQFRRSSMLNFFQWAVQR